MQEDSSRTCTQLSALENVLSPMKRSHLEAVTFEVPMEVSHGVVILSNTSMGIQCAFAL